MDNPRVVINRTVLLECPVAGIPPPAVKWLKNGQPLQTDRTVTLLSDGRQLEITSAQVTDTARYTCIASNEAGELQRNFDVEVLGRALEMGTPVPHLPRSRWRYITCSLILLVMSDKVPSGLVLVFITSLLKGNIPRISSYTWLFAKNTGWFVVLRSNP